MYHDNPSRASGLTKGPAPAEMGRISRFKSFMGFGGRGREGIIDSSTLTPLGKGAMALALKAYDRQLGMDVVVKVALDDGSALDALRNETRILMRIAHPNVIKYLGNGKLKDGNLAGHEYLEMEYMEGQTLQERFDRYGKIGWEETRGIIICICDALQAVHDAGVLHRDVNPGNIFLTGDGAKLVDFGVAKPSGLRGLMPTRFEQRNIQYTAPECHLWRNQPASDQYSVGAMIYEALSGRPPYIGNETLGFLQGAISGPKPLASCCPAGICDAVDRVVMRAISRDPGSRFRSMAMLKAAIKGI
jgi:serine/threonine protein kinase